MDLVSKKFYSHQSQLLSPMKSPPPPLSHSSHTSFPIIAVAIIGILATAFLLVSYYIFVIKCCLNWHRIDLLRRFSFSRRRRVDDPLVVHSPAVESRGLNESAIRSIPIFKFKKGTEEKSDTNSHECAVCLNEFQEDEKLRVIPNCGHVFHIDCIDVWLQNNANCPLCRTSISPDPMDQILPLNHHQDPHPYSDREEDYVVIEIRSEHGQSLSRIQENLNSGELLSISPSPRKLERKVSRKKTKKLSHVCSMGDECIDNRKKDEQFVVQPIRRSFSMDSAADSQLCLAVQEIMQRVNNNNNNNNNNNEVIISPIEGCSSSNRVKRSFFSFGQGRASRQS